MQKKIYLLVIVVIAMFFGVAPSGSVQADSVKSEKTGFIRAEILEGDDETLSQTRFYLEQCNGEKCDFEALKAQTLGGKISEETFQIEKVYLEGKFDFSGLVNREVVLVGASFDPVSVGKDVLNQRFWVTDYKVMPAPVVNNIQFGPLTLPPPTQGARDVLVMPVNFQTLPSTPFSTQQFKDWVFTGERSAKEYFEDQSQEQFTLRGVNDVSGDVTPWLTLTAEPVNCMDNSGNAWRIEADNLANGQGFSKIMYQTRILVFPNISGCTMPNSADAGVFGDVDGVRYVYIMLSRTASLDFQLRTLLHEIEHNLGQIAHSNAQMLEGGAITEYADLYADPLGNGSLSYNNNINRIKFGWLNSDQCYLVPDVAGASDFYLQTPAVATKGIGPNSPAPCAIIPLRNTAGASNGKFFILERRINIGKWERFYLSAPNFGKGLLGRIIDSNDLASPYVSGVLQNLSGVTTGQWRENMPLVPGPIGTVSWTSSLYGLTLTAYTGTVRSMRVRVTLGSNYPSALLEMREGK